MDEQKMLEWIICERIAGILVNYDCDGKTKWENLYDPAEKILESLPQQEKDMMRSYIEAIYEKSSLEKQILYRQGFRDGARVMKELNKI